MGIQTIICAAEYKLPNIQSSIRLTSAVGRFTTSHVINCPPEHILLYIPMIHRPDTKFFFILTGVSLCHHLHVRQLFQVQLSRINFRLSGKYTLQTISYFLAERWRSQCNVVMCTACYGIFCQEARRDVISVLWLIAQKYLTACPKKQHFSST